MQGNCIREFPHDLHGRKAHRLGARRHPGQSNEVRDGLGQDRILVGEDGRGHNVESGESAVQVRLWVCQRDSEALDDRDDGGRDVAAPSGLDGRETGAKETEGTGLHRRVGKVEEPEDGLREGLRRHEANGGLDAVACRSGELGRFGGGVRRGGDRSEIEEGADEF